MRMKNAELAEAISYTSTRIGQVIPASEHYWTFCNHLKRLLAIQEKRAAMLEERKESGNE